MPFAPPPPPQQLAEIGEAILKTLGVAAAPVAVDLVRRLIDTHGAAFVRQQVDAYELVLLAADVKAEATYDPATGKKR